MDGTDFEFEVALESINEYGRLIASLAGCEYKPLKLGRNRFPPMKVNTLWNRCRYTDPRQSPTN